MDLFKQLNVRIEYLADGQAKYIWVANKDVKYFEKSENLTFEINSLMLITTRKKSIEMDDKGVFYNFKK